MLYVQYVATSDGKGKEFPPSLIDRIPGNLDFINITGGEPFLRDDLEAIITTALQKTKRLVISTNGYLTESIVNIAKKFGTRSESEFL